MLLHEYRFLKHWSFFRPGVYRAHNHLVHKASRSWKKRSSSSKTLMTLDHLWWRIRDHLDGYLEVADSEVRHIQRSFVALSNYENCQAFMKGQKKWGRKHGASLEVNLRTPRDIQRVYFFDFHGIHWMIHQFAVDGRPPPTTVAADREGQDGEGLADNPLLKSRFMVKLSQNPPFLMVKPAWFPMFWCLNHMFCNFWWSVTQHVSFRSGPKTRVRTRHLRQADLEGLLQSYAASISKMKKGHGKLKTTWREAAAGDFLGSISEKLLGFFIRDDQGIEWDIPRT